MGLEAKAEDVVAAERQAQDDFSAGFAQDVAPEKPDDARGDKPDVKTDPAEAATIDAKPETAADAVAEPVKPKYIRMTEEQFERLSAAAEKTVSHEQQLSKAFGTIGNMQKVINKLQSDTPRGIKVEVPKDAFAKMARDFPELAEQNKEALEAALKGITGVGSADAEVDPAKIERLIVEANVKREIEALEDQYPDWRTIVGHVDIATAQPDPNNPFRKWLATKDVGYQARINGTNSASVIGRAIRTFRAETKPAPKPAPDLNAQLRQARMREAVQPKGDGGQPKPRNTANDEFEAGFHGR